MVWYLAGRLEGLSRVTRRTEVSRGEGSSRWAGFRKGMVVRSETGVSRGVMRKTAHGDDKG